LGSFFKLDDGKDVQYGHHFSIKIKRGVKKCFAISESSAKRYLFLKNIKPININYFSKK